MLQIVQQKRCQKRKSKCMPGLHKQALEQQEFRKAINEYVAQGQQVWHSGWKKAGFKPLTADQQHSRWGTWVRHNCSMRHG
jgi:hypothetical protein